MAAQITQPLSPMILPGRICQGRWGDVSAGFLARLHFHQRFEGTLERIVAAGGKVALARTEIQGMGWFALFTDPTGNTVGLFTDKPAM